MTRFGIMQRVAVVTVAAMLWALDGGALSLIVPADAAAPATGRVNGLLEFHCDEVPLAEDLDVLATGNDELDRDIAAAFSEELAGKSYRIVRGAGLTVGIDTRREEGSIEHGPGSLGELRARNGGVEMEMNVWSSSEDSLLVRRTGRHERIEPRLVIVATLRDRDTGKIHWRGRASGPIGNAQPRTVGLALIPPLVGALGCPVAIDDISLPTR